MLWWLLQDTVGAGILAGIVGLLCRFGRFSPAVRHALWLLVLLKLLTPPGIAWPLPAGVTRLYVRSTPPIEMEPAPLPGPVEGPEGALLALEELLTPEPAVRVPEAGANAEPSAPPTPAAATAAYGSGRTWVLLAVWLTGFLGLAGLQAVRIVRFRRLVRRAEPAPPWLAGSVAELAAVLCVRPPAALVVSGLASPCIWGLGRPRLLWPRSLTDRLAPACRRSILLHELAHVRRRDHWIGWLLLAAGCVWWWNPLFWYVRGQLRRWAELACDAWVVATLPEERRAYAEALLDVTELVSRVTAPAPALGIGGARQDFERRLTMILRDRVRCRVPLGGLACIGLLALAVLPGWSQAPAPGPKAEADKPAATPPQPGPEVEKVFNFVQDLGDLRSTTIQLDNLQRVAQGTDAKAGSSGDRDQRLREVEQKLQGLLEEVRALRAGAASSGKQPRSITVRTAPGGPSTQAAPEKPATTQTQRRVTRVIQPQQLYVVTTTEHSGVVNLTRATYHLPNAKAEALSAFLRKYIKADVMETKVDADSLTVTTTPAAQHAIGQLIGLMQERKTARLRMENGLNYEWKAVPEGQPGRVEWRFGFEDDKGRQEPKQAPKNEQPH